MSQEQIDADIVKITKARTVLESCKIFIDTNAARFATALEAALANGATETQLAPLRTELDATVAKSEEVAAAIIANTPVEPPAQRR